MPVAPFDIAPSFEPRQQAFQFAQPQLHQGMFPAPAYPAQDLGGNVVKTSPSDEDDIDDRGCKAFENNMGQNLSRKTAAAKRIFMSYLNLSKKSEKIQ